MSALALLVDGNRAGHLADALNVKIDQLLSSVIQIGSDPDPGADLVEVAWDYLDAAGWMIRLVADINQTSVRVSDVSRIALADALLHQASGHYFEETAT